MTNVKSTRHALLMSAVALLLCFAMLLGTTFAWFTDSAASASNVITSGNLNVEMYWADGTAAVPTTSAGWTDASTGAIFDYKNWEPGYVQVRHIKIANEGSLAFKYKVNIVANGTVSDLANVIDVYYVDPAVQVADRTALASVTKIGTLAQVLAALGDTGNGTLKAGESDVITLALKMQESAGNEYMNKSIGTDFSVQLFATQLAYETDSFGKDYDENAEYPATTDTWDGTTDISWYTDNPDATEFSISTAEELAGLAELVDGGNNFAGKTIKLDSDIDLASIPFNPIGHSVNGRSFNGVFDGQGHTISNMYEQSDLSAWQYEGEYYGLFAYTNGATIKNVTVADAYISSGRNEAAGVVGNAVDTTFSDITISNTTLIAYNNSAGGVAAECYGNCSFTNITVDEDTVIGPLWGTYDVRLGGVVGLVHAGNNVTFKDITVACQLDAINDVAANYQYWLYRYSGMLIGHVDAVNGVADPTGYVTCENVKVIYGDWVNYHYCEDADLGAGSYNGPGEYKYARVEAGTGTDGIDLSACNHNTDESHNVLIVFDQLFGGGQGISGLKTYDGVTVVYPNN